MWNYCVFTQSEKYFQHDPQNNMYSKIIRTPNNDEDFLSRMMFIIHYIPFFSNLLNKRAEDIFRCNFLFVKLTPRSLHQLLRTFLLSKEAAAISRVFSKCNFFIIAYLFVTKISLLSRILSFQRMEINVIAYLSRTHGITLRLWSPKNIFRTCCKRSFSVYLKNFLQDQKYSFMKFFA